MYKYLATAAVIAAAPLASNAASIDINEMANGFGVIALNTFSSTAIDHIESPVYAGGDATLATSTSFNIRGLDEVSVGDVEGAVVVGGDIVGSLNAGGSGDFVVGGTVTGSTANIPASQTITTGATIDTAGVTAAFEASAAALASTTETTGASFDGDQNAQYNFVSGTGNADGLAVIDMSATEAASFFTGQNDMTFDIAAGVSTLVVNVEGDNYDISKGFNNNAGITEVMFNFFEATVLSLNSTWNTSIMATDATLTTNTDVRGTFIVEDFVATNFEVRPFANSDELFTGTLPTGTLAPTTTVPVPAALPLAATGLALLGFVGRRRKAA